MCPKRPCVLNNQIILHWGHIREPNIYGREWVSERRKGSSGGRWHLQIFGCLHDIVKTEHVGVVEEFHDGDFALEFGPHVWLLDNKVAVDDFDGYLFARVLVKGQLDLACVPWVSIFQRHRATKSNIARNNAPVIPAPSVFPMTYDPTR